jgi:plasmid stabilization system protein ParE
MKVRALRSALLDLAEGRRFYDRQGEGLGDDFFESLFCDIDTLAMHGGIYRQIRGFHRLLSKRFPFAVYYKVLNGEAVVFRVLDCRQDPRRTERALSRD